MRRSWIITATALVILAAGSYGFYLYLQPPMLAHQVMYGNGHVEGTEIRIAAEVTGRISENFLAEGKEVDEGDILIRIENRDLTLLRERVRAEIEAMKQERKRIGHQLRLAKHHLRNAVTDVNRYRRLRQRDRVSPRELERIENAHREAEARVGILRAEQGALESRIVAARRRLDQVENQISKTTVRAPRAGTITVKAIETGELVQPGQTLAVLVDLRDIEVKVFVPEDRIGRVRLGADARIRVDAFEDRFFEARVSRVDQRAQFTPRAIHMPEERVRIVFGVTLAVENPEGILKPGMPADAWILWRPESGWPERLVVPR